MYFLFFFPFHIHWSVLLVSLFLFIHRLFFFSLPFSFSFSISFLENIHSVHSLSFQVYFRFESRHPKMCSINNQRINICTSHSQFNESHTVAKLTNRQRFHHNFGDFSAIFNTVQSVIQEANLIYFIDSNLYGVFATPKNNLKQCKSFHQLF